MPRRTHVFGSGCPLWVISGHLRRNRHPASPVQIKAAKLNGVGRYGDYCEARATLTHRINYRSVEAKRNSNALDEGISAGLRNCDLQHSLGEPAGPSFPHTNCREAPLPKGPQPSAVRTRDRCLCHKQRSLCLSAVMHTFSATMTACAAFCRHGRSPRHGHASPR